jgi:hypothetical protein
VVFSKTSIFPHDAKIKVERNMKRMYFTQVFCSKNILFMLQDL